MAAFDSYSTLKATMADWLNRADLVAQIPAFIALFESSFDDDPRARVQDSVVISTAPIANELTPVPADYAQMQRLGVPGSLWRPEGLELVTPTQLGAMRAQHRTAGEPLYYAIIGRQLRLVPVPDKQYTFEMEYYAKVPPLSDANTTNWLLREHPALYLYGSLIHAEPYLKNDDRMATWQGLYNAGMEALNITDDRALLSGAPMKMRTRGFN